MINVGDCWQSMCSTSMRVGVFSKNPKKPDTVAPWGLLASLTYLVTFRPMNDLVSENKVESSREQLSNNS